MVYFEHALMCGKTAVLGERRSQAFVFSAAAGRLAAGGHVPRCRGRPSRGMQRFYQRATKGALGFREPVRSELALDGGGGGQSLEALGTLPTGAESQQYLADIERLRALDPETCPTCKNSGMIQCPACNGSGLRPAKPDEVYRFFCETCLGKKLVRCPDCPGRCLSCG
jgi:hypothetical protein